MGQGLVWARFAVDAADCRSVKWPLQCQAVCRLPEGVQLHVKLVRESQTNPGLGGHHLGRLDGRRVLI